MEKAKYGTKKYSEAYANGSLGNYNKDTDTYELALPLPNTVVTPRKNLDLGQAVRNGTSKIGKAVGTAVMGAASLHPILGAASAGVDMAFANNTTDKILSGLSMYPVPIIKNLTKARKIIYPVTKTVSKTEPGVTRVALNSAKGELGHIDLSDSFGKTAGYETVYPEYIKVNDKGKGLSTALYAAGIKEMKKPIISGEVLIHPELTTRTYKHFDGPLLPPLIADEGYNYPIKIMTKPKNPNLYEDTIKKYQDRTAKYTDNLSEIWKLIKTKKGGR